MSSLFRTSVENFSAVEANLSALLEKNMLHSGRRPSPAEIRSWGPSLSALAADLRDAGLGAVEMLVEYQLPYSSKRADVVLAGQHPVTGRASYVVVELKQWGEASLFEDNPALAVVPSYGSHHPVSHPIHQVRSYCDYLVDYTSVLADDPSSVSGAAYLFNATDHGIHELFGTPQDQRGRMFTGQRRADFCDFLRTRLSTEPGAHAADSLLSSKVGPSTQLLAVAAEEVQSREMFVLLDQQQAAYQAVLHAVTSARRANTKTAVVVTGGPGSGKSVIALSLLGELARQGRSVMHATGSRSFTQTLRKVAGRRNPRVQKAFLYFNSFMDAEPNGLECLILDEAHRIRETSVNRYTVKARREAAGPQVDELLGAARVPVFLLDQYQVVKPGELGTPDDIEAAARTQGIDVIRVDLDAQFRSGGSEEYISWVKALVGLPSTADEFWAGDPRFDVRHFSSPAELEAWLESKRSQGFSARIAAGYCWPWSDPTKDGHLVPDVRIGTWARPWNLKGERSVGGAPAAALWATDPAGFEQVGCIYTAQGFEYDYAGVIIGPDFVRRNGAWEFVRSANKDPDFKSPKRVPEGEFERLVRNVYKVLLTRGLTGVGIVSTDEETNDYLRQMIGASTPESRD